jgi:hypothetical protein
MGYNSLETGCQQVGGHCHGLAEALVLLLQGAGLPWTNQGIASQGSDQLRVLIRSDGLQGLDARDQTIILLAAFLYFLI